jgi:hypothetical protein
MIEPLQGVTAQHCFQFAGQLSAEVLTAKGIMIAYTFLKEIDALGKIGGSAARVASTFKISDTYSEEDIPTKAKLTHSQFLKLLTDWEEKVCKLKPKEVTIEYDNDEFIIKTKD